MHLKSLTRTLFLVTLAALGAHKLAADVVETKDGARIVGKITKIDAGAISITTTYAGDLTVKQKEVTAISTDGPVAVRLESGTRLQGRIIPQNGGLQIVGPEGTITTTVPQIAAGWESGQEDPALVALERHWKYEATVDINGTSGTHNQLGTGFSFDAKAVTIKDTLEFSAAYDRQVTDGVKSTDQLKGDVDYTGDLSTRYSWFVRDVAGFDRIMDIRFYDTAAAGLGYDLIKNKFDLLTVRAGIAYRYDGYTDPETTPTVSSAAADFELAHDLKMGSWELVNKLTAVPAFNDFSNIVVTQDSFFQIPLANPSWKLRMGVSNTYDSQPPAGIQKLDTIYYTRLILDWQ